MPLPGPPTPFPGPARSTRPPNHADRLDLENSRPSGLVGIAPWPLASSTGPQGPPESGLRQSPPTLGEYVPGLATSTGPSNRFDPMFDHRSGEALPWAWGPDFWTGLSFHCSRHHKHLQLSAFGGLAAERSVSNIALCRLLRSPRDRYGTGISAHPSHQGSRTGGPHWREID